MDKLNGWKTYLVAAAAIISAVAGYFTGALTIAQMIEAIFAAISTMTIRHAITTTISDATGKKL